MSKSLFNKVAGLRPVNLIEKRIRRKCFPVNFAKFLKTTFFIKHLRWLLLYIFYWYNWFFPHNHDCALDSIGKCNLDELTIINSWHFTQEHCLRYFLFVWIIKISAFFQTADFKFWENSKLMDHDKASGDTFRPFTRQRWYSFFCF